MSVITVVYNGAKTLEQTIESVLAQEYPNLEYILVDGGSTDGTLDLIRKHEGRIDYWVSEPDRGIYDAMNKGIDLAQGEWIAFLNADDYYQPGALASVAEKCVSSVSAGIVYGQAYVLQEDMNLRYKQVSDHSAYWRGMICHPAMFVRREVYERIGKYDLSYRIASDYDFLVRAIKNDVGFAPIPTPLVNYRNSGFSANNMRATHREFRAVLGKYDGRFSRPYLLNSMLFYKSGILDVAQTAIGKWFGESALQKARSWYVKTFFARDRQ